MEKHEYKNMWVYIEHDGETAAPVGLELCSEARKLCNVTGDKLCAVILGKIAESEMAKVRACGVDEIILVSGADYEHYSPDVFANAFTVLSNKYHPSAVFVGGTINGRDFAPKFAVQVNTGCTSDAVEMQYDAETGDIQFIEPAVGGKIMAVITVPTLRPQVGTIRPGTFKCEPEGEKANVTVIEENIPFDDADVKCRFIDYKADEFDPELDIAGSDVIVCVGNGLKDEESLPRYRELAKRLGGKLGCSRPLFDREILPYKLQIGQSGVVVRPKLYICFGISGAVNHVTGVSADVFVAVNTDPEAQIFNYCDYGIVGDMDEVCDLMLSKLK